VTTFPARLQNLFEDEPDQPAVHLLYARQPDETITRADLLRGACGYARALAAEGVQPGEVVILILQHGPALVYAFWGAILHGAIPSIMPFLTEKLQPEQYRRSLAALFEITNPAAVITYPEFAPELPLFTPSHPLPLQGRGGISSPLQGNEQGCFSPSPLQGEGRGGGILPSSKISPTESVDFASLRGFERQPEDIVLLQHSSGTTGLQKGVALSHQAVFNQIESYAKALRLDGGDVVVSWLPLYHDMGLIAGFLLPIMEGIPLALMSPFDWVRAPARLLQAVSKYRGTLSWLPNFAYNFCAQKIRDRDLQGVDLTSWRAVSNCSEPMRHASHQMFAQRFAAYGLRPEALATCYAMAENVFAVTQGGIDSPATVDVISQRGLLDERLARPPQEDEPSIAMLSCGKPISGTQVKIVDDQHHEMPDRHLGEIALRSNCMLSEYYRRPDATAQAFHEGWYLTGDLGYLAAGEVYVTGRKKDVLIVGGKNVYPQDLEMLANEVPGVHPGRVVAFGVFNEEIGTEEVALIAEMEETGLPEAEQAALAQRLEDELRQRVTQGSAITLRYVKVVERGWLLKTSSGKIARGANREKYLQTLTAL
jgi:acyl-CoA synthetase (AMP-forming)/AMP-acid ligase II